MTTQKEQADKAEKPGKRSERRIKSNKAPRFQTGDGHHMSPASTRGLRGEGGGQKDNSARNEAYRTAVSATIGQSTAELGRCSLKRAGLRRGPIRGHRKPRNMGNSPSLSLSCVCVCVCVYVRVRVCVHVPLPRKYFLIIR